jgi:hypothetical protein
MFLEEPFADFFTEQAIKICVVVNYEGFHLGCYLSGHFPVSSMIAITA